MNRLTENKRLFFSALDFFAWASLAASSYDYIFCTQQVGFSNSQIGMLFAVNGLLGIISQPLCGIISDYVKSVRKVLLACMSVSILTSILLTMFQSKTAVVPLILTYTLFTASFMPLLDNWIARECAKEQGYHYGMIRIWGSIGFAIVVYIYGKLTEIYNVSNVYYGRALLFAVTMFLVFLYKYEDLQSGYKTHGKASATSDAAAEAPDKGKPDIKALLSTKRYITFMIFVFIINLPMNCSYTFFPSLLFSVGGTNSTVGLVSSLNAFIEIPFFLYSRKLADRIGSRGLILLACGFLALRMLGFYLAPSIGLLMASYWLMAPYTSFFTPGMLYYIYSLAPENTEAFAQTLVQAFAAGTAGMLGNSFAGFFVDRYGVRPLYGYGSMIIIFGILFFYLSGLQLSRKSRTKPATAFSLLHSKKCNSTFDKK